MQAHILSNLREFGLSDKEAKTYLALLELGTATAQETSNQSGINRSSTYVVMESLVRKGLVQQHGDSKVSLYVAVSPEFLAQTAKSKLQVYQNVLDNISSIVPELNSLHKSAGLRPRIRAYDGTEGLIYAMTEFLGSNKKILRAFSSGDNLMKLPESFIVEWASNRVRLGIELIGIYLDNKSSRKLISLYPHLYRAIFVSPADYPVPVDMMITDERVAYLVVDKARVTVIILDSKEVGSVMTGVFDMAFEEAKRRRGKYHEDDKAPNNCG